MAAEYVCDGCGKRAPAVRGRTFCAWLKPADWFQRQDEDGVQDACSRECVDIIAKRTGKTGVVLPI